MADMTTIKGRIAETIYPNGQGAITAESHQALLLEMVDDINSKKADQSELETLTDDQAEIKSQLTELSAEIGGVDTRVDALEKIHETLDVTVEKLVTEKVDSMDYAPNLSVGTADNLAGVDVVASDFNFRRSGGGAIADGVARVESIKGNSVVWNQLVPSLENANKWYISPTLADREVIDNGVRLTFVDQDLAPANGVGIVMNNTTSSFANHAYLTIVEFKPSRTLSVVARNFHSSWGGAYRTTAEGGKWTTLAYIYTPTTDYEGYLILGTEYGTDVIKGETLEIRNARVIDLTKMFGAGKEPTTIEDFYSLLPPNINLNAYNEGEIIDMRAEGIKSVGVNQWDEQWEVKGSHIESKNYIRVLPNKEYHTTRPLFNGVTFYDKDFNKVGTILYPSSNSVFITPHEACYMKFAVTDSYGTTYNHDICINLSDTEINGKYFPYTENAEDLSIVRELFPNGMMSAGTAHDEIRYNKTTNKWEAVKRIAEVDMGTMDWKATDHNRLYSSSIKSTLKPNAGVINAISSRFIAATSSDVYNNIQDRIIAINEGSVLTIYDSAYIDNPSGFKAAMSGVILYYELEEPIVTEITADIVENPDFNLDYLVQNGGTEQMIATEPSSAIKADITYGFNAVGLIKQQKAEIAALKAALAKAGISLDL